MLGTYPAWLIPVISASLGIFSIVICYWISQWLHQEKPLPHTWISRTAHHYPEYIIFRIGTISGSVFTIMTYFINHFWLKSLAYSAVFNLKKYKPEITMGLGIIGGMFLMGSTANLDTGKQDGDMHVFCATSFFLVSIFAMFYNTYINWILYKKARCIGFTTAIIKVCLSILTAIQVYLDLSSHTILTPKSVEGTPLSNVMEYTLAFSILGHILLIGWDVRKYKMTYFTP